jgi:hypothetical protein
MQGWMQGRSQLTRQMWSGRQAGNGAAMAQRKLRLKAT